MKATALMDHSRMKIKAGSVSQLERGFNSRQLAPGEQRQTFACPFHPTLHNDLREIPVPPDPEQVKPPWSGHARFSSSDQRGGLNDGTVSPQGPRLRCGDPDSACSRPMLEVLEISIVTRTFRRKGRLS